jgi:hypothetical protein
MSDGPVSPGSGPGSGPPKEGPDTGAVLIGCFVIAFGLCITLVGGGCTVMLLNLIFSQSGSWNEGSLLLLLSLAVLALGVWLLWVGFKLMTGGFRKNR